MLAHTKDIFNLLMSKYPLICAINIYREAYVCQALCWALVTKRQKRLCSWLRLISLQRLTPAGKENETCDFDDPPHLHHLPLTYMFIYAPLPLRVTGFEREANQ